MNVDENSGIYLNLKVNVFKKASLIQSQDKVMYKRTDLFHFAMLVSRQVLLVHILFNNH